MSDLRRKKLIVTAVIVVVPLVAGLTIAALGYRFGPRAGGSGASPLPSRRRSTESLLPAAAAAQAGSAAPDTSLRDGRSGRLTGTADLRPYGALFLSTRCGAIGRQVRQALARLGPGSGVTLIGVSADPWHDSPSRVRRWLRRHREPASFRYLTGDEAELRPYWSAWGLSPPSREGPSPVCSGPAQIHLVDGEGANAGVVDLDPETPAADLTKALAGLAG